MVDIDHLLTITVPNIVGKTTQKYNNNTKIQQQQKHRFQMKSINNNIMTKIIVVKY